MSEFQDEMISLFPSPEHYRQHNYLCEQFAKEELKRNFSPNSFSLNKFRQHMYKRRLAQIMWVMTEMELPELINAVHKIHKKYDEIEEKELKELGFM